MSERTCSYWLKSTKSNMTERVTKSGIYFEYYDASVTNGIRMAIDDINLIPADELKKERKDGILYVNYGFYPQMVASDGLQKILEQKKDSLKSTNNTYKTSPIGPYDKQNLLVYPEYEYNGKRYVRVELSTNNIETVTLSDGKQYTQGNFAWIEVQPVEWIVDEATGTMIQKKILISNIPFYQKGQAEIDFAKDFYKTDVKWFIDNCLSKDLTQEKAINRPQTQRRTRLQRDNPDLTPESEREPMSDTELIKNWIDAGESVILRGPSGIGKTERILNLERQYPNGYEIIHLKLTDNMFPEKVVGSTNIETGEEILPNFAKIAIMSEATDEERKSIEENIQAIYALSKQIREKSKSSNKKIIILLDELLNVRQEIQQLVYSLVCGTPRVEQGKGLELPANTVIVATGNQKKYSRAAKDIVEPLEKRFDHIYDMKPKVGEWLKEYAIPNQLNPAVIGYILTKYMENGRSESIANMGYFYEEPEVGKQHKDANGCNGRTNDPRGWTSISKSLANFEVNLKEGKYIGKDVEQILKTSISTKLREEWANDFFNFYNNIYLTVEDVVQKTYEDEPDILPVDLNEKFACISSLLTANEEQVEEVRNFIEEYCSPEFLAVYDEWWAGNDEKRIRILDELDIVNGRHRGDEAQGFNVLPENYKKISDAVSDYQTKQKNLKNKGEEI